MLSASGKRSSEKIARRKIAVPKGKVGIGRDFFLGCFNRSFKSAGPMGGKAP